MIFSVGVVGIFLSTSLAADKCFASLLDDSTHTKLSLFHALSAYASAVLLSRLHNLLGICGEIVKCNKIPFYSSGVIG